MPNLWWWRKHKPQMAATNAQIRFLVFALVTAKQTSQTNQSEMKSKNHIKVSFVCRKVLRAMQSTKTDIHFFNQIQPIL